MPSPFESSPESSASWPRGTVLAGRFRVEGELGRGGWGVVLAVTDEHQHPFALKLLLHDATDEALRRFAREAEVIRALHSAHVCRIHDTGSLEDGSPFIVMDRLVGDDLDEVLRRAGPLPIERAVDYVMQACDAIAEAHLNGVVHRDIKPSNLFLVQTPQGDAVKVLDFGIAKARRTDLESLTGTGAVLGSPYYMPPEQLIDSREVDIRADIWALGVTLFELITGQPCFRGKDVGELFTAVLRDEPIPLAQLRPDAPAGLGQVLARCLEKLPEDRYDTVAELTGALEPFATDGGRLLAHRIRALTFRRSAAHDAAGPTALRSHDVVAPTAVLSGSSPSYPGASATMPSSPGAPTYDPSSGSHPPAGSHPGYSPHPGSDSGQPYAPHHHPSSLAANVVSAPSRQGRARWGLVAAVFAVAVVTAIGVGVTRSGDAGKRATSPSEGARPPSKGLPEPCSGPQCDFGFGDLTSIEPAAVLTHVRALTSDRLEGCSVQTYTVMGLRPDGTIDDVEGNITVTCLKAGRVVVVTMGAGSTRIADIASSNPPPTATVAQACPLYRALAKAREAHPTAGLLTAALVLNAGSNWVIMAASSTWSVSVDEGCRMRQ